MPYAKNNLKLTNKLKTKQNKKNQPFKGHLKESMGEIFRDLEFGRNLLRVTPKAYNLQKNKNDTLFFVES